VRLKCIRDRDGGLSQPIWFLWALQNSLLTYLLNTKTGLQAKHLVTRSVMSDVARK